MFAGHLRFVELIAASPRIIATLAISALTVSCGNPSGTPPMGGSPTSPSSIVATPAGELIRGTAYDSAFRQIAGAKIEIVDGPGTGLSTMSDSVGGFSLIVPGKVEDTMRIRASKDGYVTASASPQPDCEQCNPRRWVFFYLDVLAPPVQLAGEYTLTFVANRTCTNLPEELRSRTYEATIAPARINYPSYPPSSTTSYEVTIKGSVFSDTYHLFYLNVAGSYVNVSIGDHTDPGVAERVAPNTYFAFGGWTAVTVSSPVSTISAPFQGWIEQCVLNSEVGGRYDCGPGKAVSVSRCDSKAHELILRRSDQTR
jgi:hypothetical protein